MLQKTILLLIIATTILNCTTQKLPKGEEPGTVDSAVLLDNSIKTVHLYLDTIGKSFEAENYVSHTDLSAKLLHILNMLPPEFHYKCAGTIASFVKKKGIEPYISIVIDFTYRLSRFPTRSRKIALNKFRKAIGHEYEYVEEQLHGTVLLSTDHLGNLRAYSANAGMATAALALSEEGYEVFATGGTPEDLLRITVLAAICNEQTMDGEMRSAEGMEQCNEFGDIVAGGLNDMGMDPGSVQQMYGSLISGIGKGTEICLQNEANAHSREIIAEMEQLNSCWEQQVANIRVGSDITPFGALNTGRSAFNKIGHNMQNFLDGFTPTGTDPDLSWGDSQISESFRNHETGETFTMTEYAAWTDEGVMEVGTQYVYESGEWKVEGMFDANGNAIYIRYDGRGSNNHLYIEEIYKGGKLTSRTTTNSQTGKWVIEEWDEEGNKTTKRGTLDNPDDDPPKPPVEEGSPKMSLSDWGVHPCGPDISADILAEEIENLKSELDPYIIPNPDDPITGIGSSCLQAAVLTPAANCSPSVALCIDPVYQQNGCGCSGATELPELPVFAVQCLSINCGPDGECNLATGTCQSDDEFGDIPEIWPPIADINLPPILKPPKKKPDVLPEFRD